MMRTATYYLAFACILVLGGCTGMKNISSTDPLYTGYEITFAKKSARNKKLSPYYSEVLKPKPNNRFLWMRPGIARYNMLSDSARTRKFWKGKIAAPVLRSQTAPRLVSSAIQNRLFHQGYFNNTVEVDTVFSGQRKVSYKYSIDLGEPYRIAEVSFPKPENDLTQRIADVKPESLLKPGDIYTLQAVKNERVRIDRELKEKGYIYFSPDYLTLKADTVTGVHQVKAEMKIKPETPPDARIAYKIRNVYIHDDNELIGSTPDTLQYEQYYLITAQNNLKFAALKQGIFLKPGELYSRSDYVETIRYLNELAIIRNANLKFLQKGPEELDVMLYLSQRKRFAYSAEFNTVFQSTNYFGPGVIFSYTDRNSNNGAEILKINLNGSFEMQIVDGNINPAYQLGFDISYLVPRFYPKFLFNSEKKNLPKTNISAGYNLFNRLDLYRLNSIYTNFGYRWSRTDRISHSFNPIEVVFTKLPEESKSQEFIDYLEENPGVQRSFDEQFILGAAYEFTYQAAADQHNDFFFRGGVDVAGNVLNGLYSLTGATRDSMGRYNFLGVPFSQYLRTRFDMRYTFRLRHQSSLVSRLSAGLGIPTGNSEVLPYVKQFYVGGTNSLRSFIARSLGPGSEVPPEGYNDLTGDIRLEGNLEYRFTFAGSFKGALFMDAGNIWLYNEDPTRPNARFHFDSFLSQIAISAGWGLRWDFDFIVARLDFAYTVRTPYLPEGERWANDIRFWKPAVNIAIGYPF